MTPLVPEPSPRSPFWRVVQLVGGVALFLYALRLLSPMPGDRAGFVLLVALLAAGSMALTDSIVGVIVAILDKMHGRGNQ